MLNLIDLVELNLIELVLHTELQGGVQFLASSGTHLNGFVILQEPVSTAVRFLIVCNPLIIYIQRDVTFTPYQMATMEEFPCPPLGASECLQLFDVSLLYHLNVHRLEVVFQVIFM